MIKLKVAYDSYQLHVDKILLNVFNLMGWMVNWVKIAQRKKLIQSEMEKYLRREGKSYSWDEVKTMAQNKGNSYGL